MNKSIHSETVRVRYRDCDRYGAVKAVNWFDYLQEAAANHASALGVGYRQILPLERLWVLSRLRLEIAAYPAVGEELTITTYPTPFRKIFAERQFLISSGGTAIARASSEWLFLNRRTLHPVRLSELPAALPDNSDQPVYFAFGEKLAAPELDKSTDEFATEVRYSMEDVNAHLNNAEYAGLVQDALASRHSDPFRFNWIELVWHSAVRAGDRLKIGGRLAADGTFHLGGRKSDDTLSFVAAGQISAADLSSVSG